MPTYEYECQSCGHVFERFQSITDSPLKRCPLCSRKVKRLIGSGAGIIFKGSGFYETDYRSESYKKAEKKDSSSESTPAAKSDDKKPAAAPAKAKKKEAAASASD